MKLLHISDLHLGKRLYDKDISEDQKYILFHELIGRIIPAEKPDGIIIAGDIYDRSAPSGDAIKLFDDFLTELVRLKLSVYIISGNHDSSEKISYGARIMRSNNIFISEEFDGKAKKVTAKDEYGEVDFYLIPYIRTGQVRDFYPDTEIKSYTDAYKTVLENSGIDYSRRNVAVSHQFVIGTGGQIPIQCQSETVAVGGLDGISYTVFDGMDYTALGHIHGAQHTGRKEIRYCGTLLKYSASEEKQEKSVTVVELREKGNVEIREIPVNPLRDTKILKGKLEELLNGEEYVDSYVYIELTDEDMVADAMRRLRTRFPNIVTLGFSCDLKRGSTANAAVNPESKTPLELFSDFYKMRNGKEMDLEKLTAVRKVFEQLGGDDK